MAAEAQKPCSCSGTNENCKWCAGSGYRSKGDFSLLGAIPQRSVCRFCQAELERLRARRMIATKNPGFPCRVSLTDAAVGEEVILVNYEHQSADTPFKSSHGLFVRPAAVQAQPEPGEVPLSFRSRIFSLRGFDESGMLLAADLADGSALENAIELIFRDDSVAYIHLHFAKPGCYAASAHRV